MPPSLYANFSSPDNTPEFHDEIEEALREEENTLNNDNKMQNVGIDIEEEPMDIEKIDIEGGSPLINNLNVGIDITIESEGKASSSSDSSDSDSDSDSSENSGSDRSTHSPSHSPAGTDYLSSENLEIP